MRKNLYLATEPEEARQAALRLRALGLEPPRAHLFKKLAQQAESAQSHSRKEQAGGPNGPDVVMCPTADLCIPMLFQDIASSPMFLRPKLRELCQRQSAAFIMLRSSHVPGGGSRKARAFDQGRRGFDL